MTVYSAPIPGLVLTDHHLDVPLDHSDPSGTHITVYAREVKASESADKELPWLLFLQGGPGGKSPRPLSRSGWLAEAVKSYRVLLLDQRGTGLSTPITDRVARSFSSADELANYISHFRADSIVRDAEIFRATLAGGDTWTTLGQSYGGFCTFTYLSVAPEGLEKCLITGGIPPIGRTAEEVYRLTWPRVLSKNAEYLRRFPGDRDVLNRLRTAIARRRDDDPIRLPSGDRFTVQRLQALGAGFGFSYGYAEIHYLLESAFDADEVAAAFLAEFEARTRDSTGPLYAVLQECIYSEGPATGWAATRVRLEYAELALDADPLVLVGEMKEPWIFEQEHAMQPFAAAAAILHEKDDWGPLYDLDVLAANTVPVAAAVYYDDLYVDAQASLAVAEATPNVRAWVTNEFEHDGLRSDARIFTHLHELATGRA